MRHGIAAYSQAISHRLKALGFIQKVGNWVPHELKPRDMERRFTICEIVLQMCNRESFLDRILTGEIKRVSCNMSCWNRVKVSRAKGINNN